MDADYEVILRPECIKLCPELRVLKPDEIKFIVLAYDYQTPYRLLPERERERRAMDKVWGDQVPGLLDRESIKIATYCYKGLQYDTKRELIRSYETKISKLLVQLDEETSPSQIEKITKAIDSLRGTINRLDQEITTEVISKGVIKGGGELSFLDELQSNWKTFESVIKKDPNKKFHNFSDKM